MLEDDKDMKIAGQEPEQTEPEDAAAQETLCQKQTGNWDKAERFGRLMAEQTVASHDAEWDTDRRQLVAFAAMQTAEKVLGSEVLLQAAKGAFDAELSRLDPAFYDVQCQTEDYSFYLFRIREDGGDGGVGATFASLCGRAEDAALALRGQQWYRQAVEAFLRLAAACGFSA